MSISLCTLATDRVGDTLIVTPTGDLRELDDEWLLSGTADVLDRLSDPSVKNLVIDFSQTDYFGSSALAFLIRLWKEAHRRGGRMALSNLSPHEVEILGATELSSLWPLCPTRAEAVQLVRSDPQSPGD
jgi:anti-anti-sigma factor